MRALVRMGTPWCGCVLFVGVFAGCGREQEPAQPEAESSAAGASQEELVPGTVRIAITHSQAAASGGTPGVEPEGGDAGAAGSGEPEFDEVSVFCGDGIRDEELEECDVGPLLTSPLCNWACQVTDVPVYRVEPSPSGLERSTLRLGSGRHPLAGSESGFAVALEEHLLPTGVPSVRVARFDHAGTPTGSALVSEGLLLADRPSPVVALSPEGALLCAFTDYGGDGDGLGLALVSWPAGSSEPEAPIWLSDIEPFAAQSEPDLLALSSGYVLAYTDTSDALTGPDVRVVELSSELEVERWYSVDSWNVEGQPALAPLGDAWGVAVRQTTDEATEALVVFDASTDTRWTIGPYRAPASDDQAALLELDPRYRLVLYVVGTDPDDDELFTTGQLRLAVLDREEPGAPVLDQPLGTTQDYELSSAVSHGRPGLVRVGDAIYATWTTAALPGEARGEDTWFERLDVSGAGSSLSLVLGGELPLPRASHEWFGDQRRGLFTVLPEALVAVWEDYGKTLGPLAGEPEVLLQYLPLPVQRTGDDGAADCTPSDPCGPGEGRCDEDEDCEEPLICDPDAGPNFGYGLEVGICVEPHCANGIKDADEELVDCGGEDCGECLCGDGIVSPLLGETCDEGGNTATCDEDCTPPVCGDGLVNPAAGEACDLGPGGNTGAQCTPTCQLPPVCTNGNQCLSVWGELSGTATDQYRFNLRIVNNGTQNAPLNGLVIKFWMIGESLSPTRLACDWAALGCDKVSGSVTNYSPLEVGANRVLTLTLSSTTTLAPGQNSGNFQLRLYKDNFTHFDLSNDYSVLTATAAPLTTVGLYRNGALIWGTEPSGTYFCGNGVTEPGEACDPGITPTCKSDCSGFNKVNGAACLQPNYCLNVQHQAEAPDQGNQVIPSLQVVNNSGLDIQLSRIKLKYWFTSESTSVGLSPNCYFNCPPASVSVARISPTYSKADAAITVPNTSSEMLGFRDKSVIVITAVRRDDWANMNETNDWSFTGSRGSFVSAPKVALYVDNQLWWGEEPK